MKCLILPFIFLSLIIIGITYYWYQRPKIEAPEIIPTVTVETIKREKVRIWSEFSGRLQAVDSAEIRPEVSGRIIKVCFEDGQFVKAGEVLFVIDPRPFEAEVSRAEARVA